MKKILSFISIDQKMQIMRMISLYFKNIYLQFQLFSLNNPIIKLESKSKKFSGFSNGLEQLILQVFQQRKKSDEAFEIRKHHQNLYQTIINCQNFLSKNGFFWNIIQYTIIEGSEQDVEIILLPIFQRFQYELLDIQQKDITKTRRISNLLSIFLNLLKCHPLVPSLFVQSQAFLKYKTIDKERVPDFKQQKNLLALSLRLSALPHQQVQTMKSINRDDLAKNANPIIVRISSQLNSVLSNLATIFQFLLQHSGKTKALALKWIRGIANYNLDKLKTFQNNSNLSNDGVIINSLSLVLQIFQYIREKYPNEQIIFQYFFEFSNQRINLKYPQIINPQKRTQILQLNQIKYLEQQQEEDKQYIANKSKQMEQPLTQLFFTAHTLLNEIMPLFAKKYRQNQREMTEKNLKQRLPFKVAIDIHLINEKFFKNLFSFLEFTSLQIIKDCIPKNNLIKNRITQIDYLSQELPIPASVQVAQNISILPSFIVQNIKFYTQFYIEFHLNYFKLPIYQRQVKLNYVIILLVMGSSQLF